MGLSSVILGIMLSAMLMFSTVSYISESGILETKIKNEFKDSFLILEDAWHAYRKDNEVWMCEFNVPDEDCPSFIKYDNGYLGAIHWKNYLFNKYAYEPIFPRGFSITYGYNAYGYYFCASGKRVDNLAILTAANKLKEDSSINKVIISDACGNAVDGNVNDHLAVTYWIKGA